MRRLCQRTEVFVSARTSSARSSPPVEKAEPRPRRGRPVFSPRSVDGPMWTTRIASSRVCLARQGHCPSKFSRDVSVCPVARSVSCADWGQPLEGGARRSGRPTPSVKGRAETAVGWWQLCPCPRHSRLPVQHRSNRRQRDRRGVAAFQRNFIQGADGSASLTAGRECLGLFHYHVLKAQKRGLLRQNPRCSSTWQRTTALDSVGRVPCTGPLAEFGVVLLLK